MARKAKTNVLRINVKAVADAIEADAGQPLPGLRKSLAEAKAGKVGAVHMPSAIRARKTAKTA